MVRTPSVDENGIRRGAWSKEEDNMLKAFVLKHGHSNWRQLPRFAGLARCGKSCRLRWKNYLNPDLKRGNYSEEEVEKIIKLREEHGNKWSLIASELPAGRTDNEIKNYWHTHLKKHEKQSLQSSILSTDKIIENLDQMQRIDSMEQVSIPLSTSQSVQMNGIESTAANSFLEVSSIENLDSLDSIQEYFGGIRKEPFLFNTSNDLTTQSTGYDQSILMKEFDSTGADPFPEVSSSDSFHEAYGRIRDEPFLFCTSDNQITQSIGYDSAQTFCTEPFLLDTSYSQCLPYNSALSDESIARTFECIGSEPFNFDTYNSQHLPSYESDCGSWTQQLSIDSASADHEILSTTNSNEECSAPFMPLETSDDDLLNLLAVVHSFMNGDEDQNNVTLF